MPRTKKELEDELYAIASVANKFIQIAHPYSNDEAHKLSYEKGYYPFIPLRLDSAYSIIRAARIACFKARGLKLNTYASFYFLDAGCGIGNVMALADNMGFTVHGVELCRRNARIARKVCRTWDVEKDHKFESENKVFCCNLFNFKHYHKYDVIYYYCPMDNTKLEKKFELMVEDKMKVGAILAPSLKKSNRIRKDERFKEVGPKGGRNLFLKVSK